MKRGHAQGIEVTVVQKPVARKSNADIHEHLLCEECEKVIKWYEDYGTILFTKENKHNLIEGDLFEHVLDFDFSRYYLFLVSILWRASISSRDDYAIARWIRPLSEHLKGCLLQKRITLSSPTQFALEKAIRPAILRVVDSQKQLDQSILDTTLLLLNGEHDEQGKAYSFYFMADGHLITLTLVRPDSPVYANWLLPGRMLNRRFIKIPRVCFRDLKQVHEAFVAATESNDPLSAS